MFVYIQINCDSEISKIGIFQLVQNNISWLKVSMNDALLVVVDGGIGQLGHPLRVHEGGGLDDRQAGLDQTVDELGLRADRYDALLVLQAVAGTDLAHVVKVNAYVSDLKEFDDFNEVYISFFPSSPPARTACESLSSTKVPSPWLR